MLVATATILRQCHRTEVLALLFFFGVKENLMFLPHSQLKPADSKTHSHLNSQKNPDSKQSKQKKIWRDPEGRIFGYLKNSLKMNLSPLTSSGIQIEAAKFPPAVKPPGLDKTLFLSGAGVRALEIQGNLVKFTSIGVYLEDSAVTWLSGKWKGKTSEELTESVEFFREIVTGPFHKFTRITMILPLTGKQYSEKVAENCVAIWKSLGIYSDAEAKAIDKFLEIFKDENFLPGSSILFTQSPNGFLKISFSKDESIPETWVSEIESKLLSEAILESIIGKNGVSPAARQSIASTLSKLLKENNGSTNDHKAAGEIDGDTNLKATKAYKDKDVISIPIENGNGKHKVTNE
ncbi:hypothetical protein F8388_017372 [Cannabis sativa]|uniref:Chalcone-flavonone isomerase family protein n=1 Tax=Cannabis sativa TaxID=3483 RepID=A0A7J6H915_CANSA|nr:hypothetical protein F8388_017372 [Cannabis sativa]